MLYWLGAECWVDCRAGQSQSRCIQMQWEAARVLVRTNNWEAARVEDQVQTNTLGGSSSRRKDANEHTGRQLHQAWTGWWYLMQPAVAAKPTFEWTFWRPLWKHKKCNKYCSLISLLVYSLWYLRHLQVIRDGLSSISGHRRKLRCQRWWSSALWVLFRCQILKFEDKC